MKPRMRFEKTVTTSNEKLAATSSKVVDWTIRNVVKCVSFHTPEHRYMCSGYGREFNYKGKGKSTRCPRCGYRLQTVDTLARRNKEACYSSTLGAVDGMQVQCVFLLTINCKKSKPMEAFRNEVYHLWLDSKEETTVTSSARTLGYYRGSFSWVSSVGLRSMTGVHWVISNTCVYPCYSVIPELRHNDMKGRLPDTHPMYLANALPSDHRIGTMMRAKDLQAVAYFISHPHNLDRFWQSYEVAARHHYQPEDYDMWHDTIRPSDGCGRDIHNTKYTYPKDSKAGHDRWLSKMDLMKKKRRNKERMERTKRHETDFYKNESYFFDVAIRDNDIGISTLDSLKAYKAESEKMKHCVLQCGYYAETDTVILSAHDRQGNRIKTVEFLLVKGRVVQSHGVYSSSTEFHDRIIRLVSDNAHYSLKARVTA